jgi:uncharacterized protein (TIGR02246 family)
MTKFSLCSITCVCAFSLFTSCNNPDASKTAATEAKPAFDLAAAKLQIDSANANFMDLVGKGDSVGVANCYTSDAKFMGPNGPAVAGRQGIQSVVAGIINSGATKLNVTATDVWGDENMVAEEGVMTLGTKDGVQLDRGKYIVLWKKEDGKWKLFRDCFNSDLPVPAPKK